MSHAFPPLEILYNRGVSLYTNNLFRYLIAASVMSVIVWAMWRAGFTKRKIQKSHANSKDIRREILQSLRSIAVYAFVSVFVIWGNRVGVLHGLWASYGLAGDIALFCVLLVAHDTWFYWTHRAMHHPRLFKVFHLAHHRSITPTPWAAYSFAIPEAFLLALFVPVWLLLVPTPGPVIAAWGLFQIGRNVIGHAGYEIHPRWWLDNPITSQFTTTTHHDLHHAGRFDSNYGLWFTWWDKWMKTEHKQYRAKFTEIVDRTDKIAGMRRPEESV